MKKLFLCFLATGLFVNVSFAQGKKSQDKKAIEPAKFELKTGVDSFSYAAGVSIGQNMKDQGIADLNLEAMFKAFEDVFKGNPTILNKEQANMTLQEKLQEFAKKKGEGEKAKCQQFLENNKKRPGVISLPNGLQYEIMTAGEANGMKPTPADTVVVDYVGTSQAACAICQDGISDGGCQLRGCHHKYHRTCIQTWFCASSLCPVCRRDIRGGQEDQASSVSSETSPQEMSQ
jgi:hypothetical protein